MTKDTSLYRRIKKATYFALESPDYPARQMLNVLMVVLVLASVWVMITEVDPERTTTEKHLIGILDNIFVGIFFVEYLLRLWVCSDFRQDFFQASQRLKRWSIKPFVLWTLFYATKEAVLSKIRWARQPFALIDLLAALPLFWGFRVLRVLRLLKLFRYSKRLSVFNGVVRDHSYELISLFSLAVVILGMITVAFFVVERAKNANVTLFWDAIYWTIITVMTVGYGDIVPTTSAGKSIAVIGTLSGMWVTIFMTSIIVSGLTERIASLKELRMTSKVDRMQGHYIVCGLDTLGQAVCRALHEESHPFVGVDKDLELVEHARKEGWITIRGDVTENETWDLLGLARAKSVISSFLDEANNVYVILLVTEKNPDCFIVVTGESPKSEKRLEKLGADRVVSPFLLGDSQLANHAVRPSAIRLVDLALQKKHVELELEEIKVPMGSWLVGLSLVASKVRTEFDVIIVGIVKRNDEMVFNPSAQVIIHAEDTLVCFGHTDDLERMKHSMKVV